ncbi:hypothetical protein DKY63_28230 [Pseudomonas putida]|uniref:Uncharacterized protein n=1 Tax=Pseudomonas putida TaxID=303 RepID=A0A2Z4RR57_PSEPU|nr:hypothetical protein DKY63_28230 [Pseudomonas putida]
MNSSRTSAERSLERESVGAPPGGTTGPGQWGQNKKTPLPDSPGANGVSDVFVVGGATAVGYLWGLQSQICANRVRPYDGQSRASFAPTGFG